MSQLNILFVGLSLSSSWGNGHATTYRALLKGLRSRGHVTHFYEYDAPWYRANRDLPNPDYTQLRLYDDFDSIKDELRMRVAEADAVVLGSYVNDGLRVARWLTEEARGETPVLFYDIDTPVTLRKLSEGDFEYLAPEVIPGFDAYLSFSGGRALELLEQRFGARLAVPFHCSADPDLYYPEDTEKDCALGYLGTYSPDRHEPMRRLLIEVAERLPEERFEVIGPQYPESIDWPRNVIRREHLPPSEHRTFYNRQRFTLNLTRSDMVMLGHSPSVRLFEAAACGVAVISDCWYGIGDYFTPKEEILLAESADDVVRILSQTDAEESAAIGRQARERFLAEHCPAKRASQLEEIIATVSAKASVPNL